MCIVYNKLIKNEECINKNEFSLKFIRGKMSIQLEQMFSIYPLPPPSNKHRFSRSVNN